MEGKQKATPFTGFEAIGSFTFNDLVALIESNAALEFQMGKLAVCYVSISGTFRDTRIHTFEILKGCFKEPVKGPFELASLISNEISTTVAGTMVHASESRVVGKDGDYVLTYRFHINYTSPEVRQKFTEQVCLKVISKELLHTSDF